jgi:hypothetical protein
VILSHGVACRIIAEPLGEVYEKDHVDRLYRSESLATLLRWKAPHSPWEGRWYVLN